MYQRSSTYVMTTKNGFDVLFAGNAIINELLSTLTYFLQVSIAKMDPQQTLLIVSMLRFRTSWV